MHSTEKEAVPLAIGSIGTYDACGGIQTEIDQTSKVETNRAAHSDIIDTRQFQNN